MTESGDLARIEPSAKRRLRLTGSAAREETLHADIFIQIRPMDALATRDQTPVGALLWSPMRQTGEPGEWRRDRSAIRKIQDQSIITYAYVLGQRLPELTPRNTHATTSTK
jgi:hypothetical protein